MLIMYASVLISGVLPCRRLEPEKKRKKISRIWFQVRLIGRVSVGRLTFANRFWASSNCSSSSSSNNAFLLFTLYSPCNVPTTTTTSQSTFTLITLKRKKKVSLYIPKLKTFKILERRFFPLSSLLFLPHIIPSHQFLLIYIN